MLFRSDVIIKAAAVADYRPKEIYQQKFKKSDSPWIVEMERTQDIALEVGQRKRDDQILIGFAAETEDLITKAKDKLIRKNMDIIIANNILAEGAGFDIDTNIVTMITKDQTIIELPIMSKKELAKNILNELRNRLKE